MGINQFDPDPDRHLPMLIFREYAGQAAASSGRVCGPTLRGHLPARLLLHQVNIKHHLH